MIKKILGIALIAIIAITAGWNFIQSKNEVQLSDLALANVEALANGESTKGASSVTHSVSIGSNGSPVHTYICPSGNTYVCPV